MLNSSSEGVVAINSAASLGRHLQPTLVFDAADGGFAERGEIILTFRYGRKAALTQGCPIQEPL
jgi:hypothetical protein